MIKDNDVDVKKLIDQNSVKTMLISYVMTVIYGIVAAVSAMAGREMIEMSAMQIIYSQNLQISQYGGFKRISQISAIVLMIGLWLTTFMIAWHKIEKGDCLKARIKIGVIWILGAVAMYFVFGLIEYIVVGHWPVLSGGV